MTQVVGAVDREGKLEVLNVFPQGIKGRLTALVEKAVLELDVTAGVEGELGFEGAAARRSAGFAWPPISIGTGFVGAGVIFIESIWKISPS